MTLLCFFCLVSVVRAESIPISDDDRLRWSKEFLTIYQASSSWDALFSSLPISAGEKLALAPVTSKAPLARLEFDGEDFRLGADRFRILDLRNRDFRLNGRLIHFPPRASLLEIARTFSRSRPSGHAWYSPLLRAPLALGADGFNSRLISSSELLWSDWTRVADHELSWVVVASDRLAPILPLVLVVDYALTKAEAYSTPSCEKQIFKLQKILSEQNIGLAEVDCGKSYRGNDRSFGFWRSNGKKVIKETYFCDFRMGAAEHDEPEAEDGPKRNKTAYLFDYDSLREVRALKHIDHVEKRVDYEVSAKEFETYKKQIEPIRRALFFIGTNHTCDRCPKELATLERSEAPKDIVVKASATPATSTSEKKPPGQR